MARKFRATASRYSVQDGAGPEPTTRGEAASGLGGPDALPEGSRTPEPRRRERSATIDGWWSPVPATLLVLSPICFLFLYGLAVEAMGRRSCWPRLFISVGQGVLSRGYPFETFHSPEGLAFFDHTPLFSYLLALPGALAGPLGLDAAVIAGRVISAVFGLATVILVFFLCRDLRGTVSGVVAAVLLATNPYFVGLSWVMHMEVPMAFFIVLGLYLLAHERMLWAGLAIAAAVMLNAYAAGFWLVAGGYVLIGRGWRAALAVTLPSVVAFAVWAVAAYLIDQHQFRYVLERWVNSGVGDDPSSPRFRVPTRKWLVTIAPGDDRPDARGHDHRSHGGGTGAPDARAVDRRGAAHLLGAGDPLELRDPPRGGTLAHRGHPDGGRGHGAPRRLGSRRPLAHAARTATPGQRPHRTSGADQPAFADRMAL